MELKVTLEGFPELLADFKLLSGAQQKEAMNRGLTAAALYLVGQFKIGAPVDTGFLRNAIYVRSPSESTYETAKSKAFYCHYSQKRKVGVTHSADEIFPESRGPRDRDSVLVVFGARYTAVVEAKRPFIQPALAQSKGTAMDVVRRHVQQYIVEATR